MNKITAYLNKEVKIRASLGDLIFGIATIVLNVFLRFVGVEKYIDEGYGNTFGVSPRTFPRYVFIAGIVLGCILVFQAYKKYKKNDSTEKEVSFNLISLAILVNVILFVILIKPLGYPIANLILMIIMYWLSGGKSWKKCIILAIVFTVCSVLFFYTYLRLSIPMGILSGIIR